MGGACGAPHLLGIYFISKMHTKTIQKIQKAYTKTYEQDVKIYKDIENSQGTLLLQKCRPLKGSQTNFQKGSQRIAQKVLKSFFLVLST